MKKYVFLCWLCSAVLPLTAQNSEYRERINLAGEWFFALDRDTTITPLTHFMENVTLPGTTDTNLKGDPLMSRDETTHLSRLFSYKGRAWYRKEVEIPKSWKKKHIRLFLERSKPSEVYVDGILQGKAESVSTGQDFDLSKALTPGRHTIDVMVDNGESVPPQLLGSSHAYTEDTQTNWNGIIGEIYLEAAAPKGIIRIEVQPFPRQKQVGVKALLRGKPKDNDHFLVRVDPYGWNGPVTLFDLWPKRSTFAFHDTDEGTLLECTVPLGADAHLWSEFSPDFYQLELEWEGVDSQTRDFGLVDFQARDHHFYVNGIPTFLRGKHDACVFPLTAHVPMDDAAWRKYLGKCKKYGINHVRFHSWCPPEAAFLAADALGIYLQPELPFWGDFNASDERLMTYLHQEGERIIRTYGHHPSFVMFALGNELWGSIEKMGEFVADFRQINGDILYTFGSNYYLGYQGVKPGMDYFTTCRTGGEAWGQYDTHTRGSFSFADAFEGGMINHFAPNLSMNFEEGCRRSSVPVISHETAQFQTYPDYDEMRKYTGVLTPCNMEVFQRRLQQAGMADQAKAFHRASGAWSLELYKADIEMDMRTRNMAGFQLLDLQDYPGQGSAYVGMLDAMMDEKDCFDDNAQYAWQGFCAPVVPLLQTDRYCLTSTDTLHATLLVANYGGSSLRGQSLTYQLSYEEPKSRLIGLSQDQSLTVPTDSIGLITVGDIHIPMASFGDEARQLWLSLTMDEGRIHNEYKIWVYPASSHLAALKEGILITHTMDEPTGRALEEGASVLLMPDSTLFADNTVGSLFMTDYWNYRMFKTICENNKKTVSPGTLGILTDPAHPLFGSFPTEGHTDWQWWPVVRHSTPLILDNLPADYRPLVQVIDNIERNHHLGLVMEFAVGKGRLLICMSNLEAAAARPEGEAFYRSLLEYMHSSRFQPSTTFRLNELMPLLKNKVGDRQLDELNNISPY
mgnify:CR=1 FL=1